MTIKGVHWDPRDSYPKCHLGVTTVAINVGYRQASKYDSAVRTTCDSRTSACLKAMVARTIHFKCVDHSGSHQSNPSTNAERW